jgi:hypothetical protein
MSASRVVIVVGVIVLCSALNSKTQQTPTAPSGTFQLVPAEYSVTSDGASWEEHTVFLLDSKGGQVWEYSPATKTSDGKFHDSALVPVKQVVP